MILQVYSRLYRGARPQPADFAEIKATFQRVISLEGPEEDKKEQQELSPLWVMSDPINFAQIYLVGISQHRLYWILQQIVAARTTGNVLVHCEHGEDRTGLIVAAYRVWQSGWTKEAAMAEAIRLGYRSYLNYGLNRTWRGFCQ
jgi:protein-tyrosine phosphatase